MTKININRIALATFKISLFCGEGWGGALLAFLFILHRINNYMFGTARL